jgi:hypothetical protein
MISSRWIVMGRHGREFGSRAEISAGEPAKLALL